MNTHSRVSVVMTIAFVCISIFAKGARINQRSQYIVKTISIDGGDIVDCIDMYKQPALSHPLLVNHTIETAPSKQTSVLTSKNEYEFNKLLRSWRKNGRCPRGSIPIIRQLNFTHQVRINQALPARNSPLVGHQYAVIEARKPNGTILGASAIQNVWNPIVNSSEGFSLSQIWLVAGTGQDLNTMEAGWHVYPLVNGDSQTRMFIYWTSDNYESTGCHDVVNCPGFVQTNEEFLVGCPLDFSTYGGQQIELTLSIEKDILGLGNWWLYVNGYAIGYWPQAIFTSIGNGAEVVQWGGEVYDSRGGTWNQMGNGHSPNEGFQRSTYTHGMQYLDSSVIIQPTSLDLDPPIVTVQNCYDLQLDSLSELYLFFGGPGGPGCG